MSQLSKMNKGFSFIEILVATALLGISGYVYMNTQSNSALTTKASKGQSKISDSSDQLMNGLKSIIFDTKNGLLKSEGACKWISTDPNSKPPVAPVYLNMANTNLVLNANRFKTYFADWNISKHTACGTVDNLWSKCIELKPNAIGVDQAFLQLKPVVRLEITPVNMNPENGKLFQPLTALARKTNLDAKSVGYNFNIQINTLGAKGVMKKNEVQSFEWIGLIGYCDIGTNKLSITGMETVMGSNVIFNRNGFSTNQDKPFEVSFKSIVAQEGQYSTEGNYITTDVSKNVVTSCNEVKFRCRNDNANQREYGPMFMVADLYYNTPNQYVASGGINSTLSYSIKNNQNTISISKLYQAINGPGDDTCMSPFDAAGKVKPICSTASTVSTVANTDKQYSISFTDTNSNISNNSMCRQICTQGNSFNTNGKSVTERFGGYLNIAYPGFNKSDEYSVSDGIACTACYMKSCDQLGLGTFGPMNKMPKNPADSTLPECIDSSSTSIVMNSFNYTKSSLFNFQAAASTSKCIAAKLNSDEKSFTLKEENCNTPLPVMCYNYGKYILARDFNSTTAGLASSNYNNAESRCFKMSQEVSDKAAVDNLVVGIIDLPIVGTNYSFYNLTYQGKFIAPQDQEDIDDFVGWMKNPKNQVGAFSYFWIGLKSDGASSVISRLPVISTINNTSNNSLYWNGTGNMTQTNFTWVLPVNTSTQKNSALLYHNIKFKGVKLVRQNDPYADGTQFPFLCRGNNGFFISNAKAKDIYSGSSSCKNEGGLFLPPLSTNQWTKAMLLLAPNGNNKSFPIDGSTITANKLRAAWVAIETSTLDEQGVNWTTLGLTDLANDSNYKTLSSDAFITLDKNGDKQNPRAYVESNSISGNIQIDSGMEFSFDVDNNTHKKVINNSGAQVTYTIPEFVTLFNSIFNDSRAMLRYDTTSSHLILEKIAIGPGQISLNDPNGNKKPFGHILNFGNNPKSIRGKDINELCVTPDNGNIAKINYQASCTQGSKVTKEDIAGSELYKNTWKLSSDIKNETGLFYLACLQAGCI